ncbi:MAG TPA: hypothetical protein P5511_04680, partial [Candidatus Goldiibacteriota bacterium]|nr:hypothetical protein [Candidatus Goldiibacteriota bacterium]
KEALKDFGLRKKISEKNIYAVSSSFHSAFGKNCGFKIAAEFAGPDSLNPEMLSGILRAAREKKASIIISNMTGNHGESADIINRQLRIKKIEMIVFPLEREGESGFFRVYRHNLRLALEAAGVR